MINPLVKLVLVFGEDSARMLSYTQERFDLSSILCFPFEGHHPTRQANYIGSLINALVCPSYAKLFKKGEVPPKVIVTHSEAILTRLQTKIAQGVIKKEEVLLLRVIGKRVTTLKLNDSGDITNWPKNFFGDFLKESFDRVLASTKKKGSAQTKGLKK